MTIDPTATPLTMPGGSAAFSFQTPSRVLRVRLDAAMAALTTVR